MRSLPPHGGERESGRGGREGASHDPAKPSIFNGRRLAFLLEYVASGGAGNTPAIQLIGILRDLVSSLSTPAEISEGHKKERLLLLYLLQKFPPPGSVICPSVELLNVEGDKANEIDFVVLSASAPHVRLVECTISDGEEKARSDARKMNKLADRLRTRYESATVHTILVGDGMEKLRNEGLCDEYIDAKDVR